uniref:Uncharacterized protein n=1 Tax=Anguilla anguilla TaxID=7936 RepID=A0A0E9QC28_ANGAN
MTVNHQRGAGDLKLRLIRRGGQDRGHA